MIALEDKVTLSHRRAELVTSLTGTLSVEDRVRIQGELSLINAKIKAQNTMQAAQLKATADQRKVAGLAEAQANAARARARANGTPPHNEPEPEEADEDPDQTAVIDAWMSTSLGPAPTNSRSTFPRSGRRCSRYSSRASTPPHVDRSCPSCRARS